MIGPRTRSRSAVERPWRTPDLHPGRFTEEEPDGRFLKVVQRDQARLFHRDQRLKKASRERLNRTGTESPPRKKLADIDDTDEPGTEDWGRQGGNHHEGMSATTLEWI